MIAKKDVGQVAELARIELAPEEKVKLEKDLSGILEFVAKLNEVDVSHVEPLTGGTELENVMRKDDEPTAEDGHGAELVEAAPRKQDGYIAVKPVFDRG